MKSVSSGYLKTLLAALLVFPGFVGAVGQFPVEEGFLDVTMDQMTLTRQRENGIEHVYLPPNALKKLARYNKLMVDQPEIWIDADSDYRGVKPDNIKAIADLIREAIADRLIARGYDIVDKPGPDVVYLRVAITDLYLKKKKRGVLSYTPAGAMLKLGADAVRDMLEKVDIIEMALQAEMQDSQTEEILAAIIVKRGARKDKEARQKEERIDFPEFRRVIRSYAAILACRLDNARQPEERQVDCFDKGAMRAAGYLLQDG